MKLARWTAIIILALAYLSALGASFLATAPYDKQFREAPSQPPSRQFFLGTDELGRDRLSRLLHGSRVSLVLAPAAALLATGLAAFLGAAAALAGGWWDRAFAVTTDLSLSLPWLFVLITVRAALPLDVAPWISLSATFLLLGVLGWAGPARVVRSSIEGMKASDFVRQARASGASRVRILFVQMLPNLRPILLSQFIVSIPVFILSEANLSLLGLGVAEPLPSWGTLLRELENVTSVTANPWMLAPALVLIVVVVCIQILVPREDFIA
jgi:ABC-type dipeptide/oligopeptide/nickel transport system permease subunit